MTHGKAEGGKRNFAVCPACEFIAAITITQPKEKMFRNRRTRRRTSRPRG
jgi:hypothetical protein